MKSEDIKVVAEMISAYHQESVVPVTKELIQAVKVMEQMMTAISVVQKNVDRLETYLTDKSNSCCGDCCDERED